ncbi:hypothetical protein Taro_011720 [Colocasia esculenta]|uniref:Uncharacterized protein n=1 Tax=Colocasia esculenta TaxID=4460 RepID=A0A843UBM8_COLES|nr:hypothetical protein [Colocasia esculenta]
MSVAILVMASHGRRSTQAQEDEQRCEEMGSSRPQHPRVPRCLLSQAQAKAPAPIPKEHGHGGLSIMERFKRMDLPSFKGESHPLLAESWMRVVEKILHAIRCAEEDNVSLVTYMLQPECVDTTRECVDTLSHFCKTVLLGTETSVDTAWDCVDTLSQSGNWNYEQN